MNKLIKFLRLTGREKKLFIEAVFFLFFSKVFLFLPFRICVKWIEPSGKTRKKADEKKLIEIRKAIRRADKLSFWKNVCLVKSVAARFMLQRRKIGSEMYLGLQFKNKKELIAHAWLISDDVYITPKGTIPYKEIFSV